MNTPFNITSNNLRHFLFSIVLGLWVACFLFFTEPFELWRFKLKTKLILVLGYGCIAILCYGITLLFQHQILKKSIWKVKHEILFMVLICLVGLLLYYSFYYVMVPHHTKAYSVWLYFKLIYSRALLIILPIVIIGRYFLVERKTTENKKITISGAGKKEFANLYFSQIVYIKSSNNYVEVFYKENETINKKVIRKTFKSIVEEFPELLRTHRSFLINPSYFKTFSTGKNLMMAILEHNIEIPISNTYKKEVEATLIRHK